MHFATQVCCFCLQNCSFRKTGDCFTIKNPNFAYKTKQIQVLQNLIKLHFCNRLCYMAGPDTYFRPRPRATLRFICVSRARFRSKTKLNVEILPSAGRMLLFLALQQGSQTQIYQRAIFQRKNVLRAAVHQKNLLHAIIYKKSSQNKLNLIKMQNFRGPHV